MTPKHPLKTSPRFIASGESSAVEFVVLKHFTWESLHVEPSCSLDVVVYMLKCVHSGVTMLNNIVQCCFYHAITGCSFFVVCTACAQRYLPSAAAKLSTPKKEN